MRTVTGTGTQVGAGGTKQGKPGDNAPAPLRTMDTLSFGESAVVSGVTLPSDRLRLRLLYLGFVPGTRVRLIGHAPGGDPVTVALRGTSLHSAAATQSA